MPASSAAAAAAAGSTTSAARRSCGFPITYALMWPWRFFHPNYTRPQDFDHAPMTCNVSVNQKKESDAESHSSSDNTASVTAATPQRSTATSAARPFNIVFVGDFMPLGQPPQHVDASLRQLFSDADLVVGNLETPLVPNYTLAHALATVLFHSMSQSIFEASLNALGIVPCRSVWSLANNHIFDMGKNGLAHTAEYVTETAGAQIIGAVDTLPSDAKGPGHSWHDTDDVQDRARRMVLCIDTRQSSDGGGSSDVPLQQHHHQLQQQHHHQLQLHQQQHQQQPDESQDSAATDTSSSATRRDTGRIGLVGWTRWLNIDAETEADRWHVLRFHEIEGVDWRQVKADLNLDLLIAFPHWGVEFVSYPEQETVDTAQMLTDAGFDLIVGCHSHLAQPLAWLHSRQKDRTHTGQQGGAGDVEDGEQSGSHAEDDTTRLAPQEKHRTLCAYSLGDFNGFPAPAWLHSRDIDVGMVLSVSIQDGCLHSYEARWIEWNERTLSLSETSQPPPGLADIYSNDE